MFHIGFHHDSSLNKPDSSTLAIQNSIATVVEASVFSQNLKFGEQFARNYEYQSFCQLVNTRSMDQGNIATRKPNSSSETEFRYSHKSYGRKPIVESFFPLEKDVTILLDFERFDNFGTLELN